MHASDVVLAGLGAVVAVAGVAAAACAAGASRLKPSAPAGTPVDAGGYRADDAAVERFREAEAAIDCRPLLERAGIDPANMPSERDPEYYAKRPCPRLVREAAAILADELNA